MTPTPTPHKVIVVPAIPPCDFCGDSTPGPYDAKTVYGPWASMCRDHWAAYADAPHGPDGYPILGTGWGQLWITDTAATDVSIGRCEHGALAAYCTACEQ